AACLQAWSPGGRTPADVLRGVASALWGRAAMTGGPGMAAIGLAMHFTVALTATVVFYGLSRRMTFLRSMPLWIVGPLYGVVVFCAMTYGTLPALSWLRSLYLHTPPRWPGSMSWPQLLIHMVVVGPPILWGGGRRSWGGCDAPHPSGPPIDLKNLFGSAVGVGNSPLCVGPRSELSEDRRDSVPCESEEAPVRGLLAPLPLYRKPQ